MPRACKLLCKKYLISGWYLFTYLGLSFLFMHPEALGQNFFKLNYPLYYSEFHRLLHPGAEFTTNNEGNTRTSGARKAPKVGGITGIILDGYSCPGIPYVVDSRDGNTYPTVLVGSHCWLSQNLRYLPEVHPPSESSVNQPRYYVTGYYGHDTEEAMRSLTGGTAAVLYNYQAAIFACPRGWQLPGEYQWGELWDHLTANYPEITPENIGNRLKSCRQVDSPLEGECTTDEQPRWDPGAGEFGTDDFNFSALPAGCTNASGQFIQVTSHAYWWSSASTDQFASYREINAVDGGLYRHTEGEKKWGLSVRCVLSK